MVLPAAPLSAAGRSNYEEKAQGAGDSRIWHRSDPKFAACDAANRPTPKFFEARKRREELINDGLCGRQKPNPAAESMKEKGGGDRTSQRGLRVEDGLIKEQGTSLEQEIPRDAVFNS
jgi:hypothetical protein